MKTPPSTKGKARPWEVAVFGIVIFGSMALYDGYRWSQLSAVAASQRETHGLIISLGPFQHGPTYKYSYTIGRTQFFGSSADPMHYEGYKDKLVGETATVYYDPSKPDHSSLFPFSEMAGFEFRDMVAMLAFMVFLIALAITHRLISPSKPDPKLRRQALT